MDGTNLTNSTAKLNAAEALFMETSYKYCVCYDS